MIADDEANIRNGLREIIPWESYHAQVVEAAPDGPSALAAIRRIRPDLVVLDIKMPGMDGLEVLRVARAEGIESRFIILSGYNDFPLAQAAIRHGANAYYLKPLKVDEFKDELSRQFADLMSADGEKRESMNVDTLVHTSRLFLLTQLIRNELHGQEELERRLSMLHMRMGVKSPCCVTVLTSSGIDRADLTGILRRAEGMAAGKCMGERIVVWTYMDEYVMMLAFDGAAEKSAQEMRAFTEALMREMRKELGVRFVAGIGGTVSSPLQAAQSFSVALRALTYDLYQLPGGVYDAQVICTRMPEAGQPSALLAERIYEAVESGDEAELDSASRAYVNALLYVPMPPPDYVRAKCMTLVSATCERMNAAHASEGPFEQPRVEDMLQLRTLEALKAWMTEAFEGYRRRYRSARRMADPLVEAAKRYIASHLSDNIKASDVAGEVNLSTSYFMAYFKDKAGCNFRDYVLGEKMRYARELLMQGMNVSEIATAIGYTDYRSFSRAFKNVTGHTPSDFMKK